MDCRNPNCDGKLGLSDGACKQCGTWRRRPVQRIGDTAEEIFPVNVDGYWVKPANKKGKSHKVSEGKISPGTTSKKPASRYRRLEAYRQYIIACGFLNTLLLAGLGILVTRKTGDASGIFLVIFSPLAIFVALVIAELLQAYIDIAENSHQQRDLINDLVKIEKFKLKRSGQMPRE